MTRNKYFSKSCGTAKIPSSNLNTKIVKAQKILNSKREVFPPHPIFPFIFISILPHTHAQGRSAFSTKQV